MRLVLRIVLFLLIALLLFIGGGYIYLRQSLPSLEGELRVDGLGAPVEILRDRHGVPHIFARSEGDAHFALGFVHAQDRLWQLEMNRRIASGRLAEIAGAGGLDVDRFMRTLGLRRAAEANLAQLDAETRGHLEAYAAGVNAFLATRPVLPPEFLLTQSRPEPWSPVDSLAWLKTMAWDLGGNWRSELLRMRLSQTLPVGRIQQLLPPYPGDAPLPLPDLKERYPERQAPRVAANNYGPDPELGGASNSWVVAKGESGKPLLANDPHLGLTAPPVWYLAHLHAPGLNAIGATMPGLPSVIIGRNDRIAWGFTSTGPDVQDLYLERVDTLGEYLTPEGSKPFTVIRERIEVKGEPAREIEVRVSRHGPVISDVVPAALEAAPRGYVLALAWTALAEDDRTMQSALRAPRARDWKAFETALRDLHSPQQTVTYADVDGTIAYIAAGRVPVRRPENDLHGLAPAPGWDPRYDWTGYLSFEELPREVNPPSGRIVAANHKLLPPGYAHFITSEWQAPYRARRIEALLDDVSRHDARSFARIQGDTVSLAVRELLPLFLSAEPQGEREKAALEMLRGWDGTMAADRPEPLIALAWWRELARAVYADELGSAFGGQWQLRPIFLANVLSGRNAEWCDDVRTPLEESCELLLARSLERALADLSKRYGDDLRAWKWGEAHQAQHRHRPFSRNRWLAALFDIRVPSPGDTYTVNVGRMDLGDPLTPFANRHAASYRAIYDLGNPEASRFIQSAGQSGNPLSRHYDDLTDLWVRGEYLPMITDRARLEKDGVRRLVLTPRN